MKIYISGKITGFDGFKQKFEEAEKWLKDINHSHSIMNPAVLNSGFEHHEYMHICYAMIDVCEAILMLDNWSDSKGAIMELDYALKNDKRVIYMK